MAFVLTGLLLVGIGLSGTFDRDLWTPDEPRVAAVALETSRTGDLVVPHLAGKPFVQQPPLYYAVAAGALKVFAPFTGNTGAIRLTSVLWGLGTLVVAFFLARRVLSVKQGLPVVLVMGTMVGFIESTHWIRVDIALLFFVTAAVWLFAESLLGSWRWLVVPAGLCTAGAFLVKGVVGPGVIAFGWFALLVARVWDLQKAGYAPDAITTGSDGSPLTLWNRVSADIARFIWPHILAGFVFVGIAGTWAMLFRSEGGQELWNEWFWNNQVGRAAGTTPQLGHLKPGQSFYYFKTIALYSLPWTPLIGVWVWRLVSDLRIRRTIEPVNLFLLIWTAATVVVMTISATKRDLYLLPVLPAFALMCANVIDSAEPRWCRVFFTAWSLVCTGALAVCALSPLLIRIHGVPVSEMAASFLAVWSPRHILAGICVVLCTIVILKTGVSTLFRTAIVTALACIGLFAVAGKAVDLEKSMSDGVRSFAGRISETQRSRVAGWGFSETMRGAFYYYCDWPVTQLDDEGLRDVLAGKNPRFDSVIVATESGAPVLGVIPQKTLAEASIGPKGHERKLLWLCRKDKDVAENER